MKTYTVIVRRVGKWWDLEAPDVPFGNSQCRRLDQAEGMIREAIAAALDVTEDSFGVTLKVEIPADVEERLEHIRAFEADLAEIREKVRQEIATTTRTMVLAHHLSYRDAGQILGVSHQRVGQILKEAERSDDEMSNA